MARHNSLTSRYFRRPNELILQFFGKINSTKSVKHGSPVRYGTSRKRTLSEAVEVQRQPKEKSTQLLIRVAFSIAWRNSNQSRLVPKDHDRNSQHLRRIEERDKS